jgi:hypothetical protein
MPMTYEEPVQQDEYIFIENDVVETAAQELTTRVKGNAVGATAHELTMRVKEDLVKMFVSVYRTAELRGDQNRRSVHALAHLRPNWDSYGAPAPNGRSIANAIRVLNLLESLNLDPTKILPSAEGGVGICFVREDRYADIECSNEGEVLGVYYVGSQMPALLETDATDASISAALERIRNHIRG